MLLRVPKASVADAVTLRYVRDGEPQIARAEVDRETDVGRLVARDVSRLRTSRRRIAGCSPAVTSATRGSTRWACSRSTSRTPTTSSRRRDRVAPTGTSSPSCTRCSRIASRRPGATWRRPTGRSRATGTSSRPDAGRRRRSSGSAAISRGIEERLDHLTSLGVNVLYLTPVFPAGSTHRYDATTFDAVDPLLGGDDAFASLVAAAHARGIRVLGDLTTNHVGSGHEWFEAARAGARARARVLLLRRRLRRTATRAGTACRRCRSSTTGPRSCASACMPAPGSVVRRWLEQPYDLDGWRIDVANMTGRLGAVDHLLDVAPAFARAATAVRPDARRRRRARPRRACGSPPRRVARDDELHGIHASGVGVAPRRRPCRRRPRPASSSSRSESRDCRASRSSARCARTAQASRGRRRCTRGRSSTATTRRASA